MGCNVSKDVKVEDQGNATINGGDKTPMSEEKAAEKIQASFRGYKTRKTLKDNGVALPARNDKIQSNGDVDEKTEELPEHPETKKPGSALSTDPDEIVDIDLNDVELEKAAAKIQASYRNFTAKKKQQENTPSTPPGTIQEKKEPDGNDGDDLDDIDLGDPEVEKAALKIQSTFRGYKVRKETTVANGQEEEEN